LTGYSDEEDFGASEQNVSFGRYYKGSTGTFNFVAMSALTPGWANAYPKVGPIVINEIMYHPVSSDAEYIELLNITGSSVTLYDYATSSPWSITDGIDYLFPDPAISLGAGQYLILAKDLALFNTTHPGVTCQKFEWTSDTKLSNGGERLELGMPGDEDDIGGRLYIRIDRVNYDDEGLWPTAPDGFGPGLSRIDSTLYGNDPNNWQSAAASPGLANP